MMLNSQADGGNFTADLGSVRKLFPEAVVEPIPKDCW